MTVLYIIYYNIPSCHQWKLLLCASYIFYGFFSPVYLVFLLFTTAVTYTGAIKLQKLHIEESENISSGKYDKTKKKVIRAQFEKRRKYILALTIIFLLPLLIVFKYSAFIFNNVSALVGIFGIDMMTPELNIILPVGLSFYLFQSMGYCIDVYRGMCSAERSFLKYALFVSFFPQLLQGPIGNYERLAPQLFGRHVFDYTQSVLGIQRIAWGLFKKLVIANQIEETIGVVFDDYTSYSGIIWLFVLFLYAIEIYADFSGYMDIANGCAGMLGITLDENFDTPYFSSSVAEFWRRWHMTLGSWFRIYLFYPLLRSKKLNKLRKNLKNGGYAYLSSILPTAIALIVVWLSTGAWHGADWGYIVWGLYYGIFVVLDTIFSPVYLKWRAKYKIVSESKLFQLFRIMRTFCIVVIGYGIFRPADMIETVYIFRHMFDGLQMSQIIGLCSANMYGFVSAILGIIVLFFTDIYHLDKNKKSIRSQISQVRPIIRYALYMTGLCAIALFGTFGQSSFIYFGF